MKKIKNSLIILLIVTMVLLSLVMTFADTKAIKFTDIDKSWAKQNIINVYNKGLMVGDTETLFKPAAVVTQYQALVSIAKMARASEKYDLESLEKEYKVKYLDTNNVPANVRKEISFCLKTGIVKPGELASFKTVPIVTRQVLTIYLGRAFGIVYDSAKPAIVLKYADAIGIIKEGFPHINYLVNLGVFAAPKTSGDNFNPNLAVTKEVMAKILDVASDKYDELFPSTSPITTIPPADTTETTNTSSSTDEITIPNTEAPSASEIDTETNTIAANFTGIINSIYPQYGVIVFTINGDQKTFAVANDMKCSIDGVEGGQYWRLNQGDEASMYVKDNQICKLEINSKIIKLSGVLTKINSIGKVSLTIKNSKGELNTYYINEKTPITKVGAEVSYKNLKVGDNLTISLDGTDVTLINADGVKMTDKGTIESVIFSRTAPAKIVISRQDGQRIEYYMAESEEASIYNLRPGMQISLDIENQAIIELTTINNN